MRQIFSLKYKDEPDVSPIKIIEENVHQLEILCKKANKEDFQVVLYSPEKYYEYKNVYELSAILAEDMILKFNENNLIIRDLDKLK